MGPPGGARSRVDPRFISLFNTFEVQTPSTENLRAIYQTILGQHLAGMPAEVGAREWRAGPCLLGVCPAALGFTEGQSWHRPPQPPRAHALLPAWCPHPLRAAAAASAGRRRRPDRRDA
jgi:hypothetical protein